MGGDLRVSVHVLEIIRLLARYCVVYSTCRLLYIVLCFCIYIYSKQRTTTTIITQNDEEKKGKKNYLYHHIVQTAVVSKQRKLHTEKYSSRMLVQQIYT